MKLIVANALIKKIQDEHKFGSLMLTNMINEMPDVHNDEAYSLREPIKNRYRHRKDNDCEMLECPECECRILANDFSCAVGNRGYSFCPYCGADLREERR